MIPSSHHGLFTCAIPNWNVSRELDTSFPLTALRGALSLCIPEIHHSDQGIQYADKIMGMC